MSEATTDRFVVTGSAGHIDHGKTQLVKALTGVDTDRLEEEKARGISIELGFAELQLDAGITMGLVDVPGHERFIRNMLAGVGGIDLVLLVIAADEGVMPQTREHLDIIDLLSIEHGVVAITKCDLVDDPEWLELVHLDVEELISTTSIAGAPLVNVSGTTGEGLDALRASLVETAQRVPRRDAAGTFRMPVDRSFTARGFGTVVTGTVWSGAASVGETLESHPYQRDVRIRNIQVHGRDRRRAVAGQRAAMVLHGVDRTQVARGTMLSSPGTLEASYMLDARIRVLERTQRGIEHRQRVHFHHGTSECLARIVPLESETIAPGESGLVQLRLEEPQTLLPGDRFVVRSYSPVVTIAGGVTLDPWALKHRRNREDVLQALDVREGGSAAEVAVEIIRAAGPAGMAASHRALGAAFEGSNETPTSILNSAEASANVVQLEQCHWVARFFVDRAVELMLKLCLAHHESHPLKPGIPRGELLSRVGVALGDIPAEAVLAWSCQKGVMRDERGRVSLPDFSVEFNEEDQGIQERIVAEFSGDKRLSPPSMELLLESLPGGANDRNRSLFHGLLGSGQLVKVSGNLVLAPKALEEFESGVRDILKAQGEVSVPQLRDRFGISRKFLIPLLEHLDRRGITRRAGDLRVPGGTFERT